MSQGNVGVGAQNLAGRRAQSCRAASMADRVQKLDECCAQLCRSYAFPGTQQVCAEHSTSFCALLLGMGRDMSRLAAGVVSQAAHNRQRERYRLGLPRHRRQPALHRQCERLWGCVQNDRVYEPSAIPPSQPQRGSAMTPYTDAHSSNGASTRRPSVQCRTRLSPR